MTEKEIIQKIYEAIKLVDCMQYNPLVDFNYLRAKGAYNIIKNQVEHIEAENAELREKLSNSIDTEQIAKYLAERLDCPCNFSPIDEEMFEFCRERECNSDESRVCWERVIARLKEIKEEI